MPRDLSSNSVLGPNGHTKKGDNKILTLETLRFLAISLIFLSHCSFITDPVRGGAYFNVAGTTGVSIFFVLSGFLTFATKAGTPQKISLKNAATQLKRKLQKVYPIHFITFLAAVPLTITSLPDASMATRDAVIAAINLLLIQSWFPDQSVYFSYNAVSWFLSAYFFMVIMTPLLLKVVGTILKAGKYASLLIAIIGIAAILSVELLLADAMEGSSNAHWALYIFPPTRLLDYAAGMLIGLIYLRCKNEKREHPALFAVLALADIAAITGLLGYALSIGPVIPNLFFSAIWLVPSLLLVLSFSGLDRVQSFAFLRSRPLVKLGSLSMAFFLIHLLVIRYYMQFVSPWAIQNPLASFLICYAASWVLAWMVTSIQSAIKGRHDRP